MHSLRVALGVFALASAVHGEGFNVRTGPTPTSTVITQSFTKWPTITEPATAINDQQNVWLNLELNEWARTNAFSSVNRPLYRWSATGNNPRATGITAFTLDTWNYNMPTTFPELKAEINNNLTSAYFGVPTEVASIMHNLAESQASIVNSINERFLSPTSSSGSRAGRLGAGGLTWALALCLAAPAMHFPRLTVGILGVLALTSAVHAQSSAQTITVTSLNDARSSMIATAVYNEIPTAFPEVVSKISAWSASGGADVSDLTFPASADPTTWPETTSQINERMTTSWKNFPSVPMQIVQSIATEEARIINSDMEGATPTLEALGLETGVWVDFAAVHQALMEVIGERAQ